MMLTLSKQVALVIVCTNDFNRYLFFGREIPYDVSRRLGLRYLFLLVAPDRSLYRMALPLGVRKRFLLPYPQDFGLNR